MTDGFTGVGESVVQNVRAGILADDDVHRAGGQAERNVTLDLGVVDEDQVFEKQVADRDDGARLEIDPEDRDRIPPARVPESGCTRTRLGTGGGIGGPLSTRTSSMNQSSLVLFPSVRNFTRNLS